MKRLSRYHHLPVEFLTALQIYSVLSHQAKIVLDPEIGHVHLVVSPTFNVELHASDALSQPFMVDQDLTIWVMVDMDMVDLT